jgi:hypothetical protein
VDVRDASNPGKMHGKNKSVKKIRYSKRSAISKKHIGGKNVPGTSTKENIVISTIHTQKPTAKSNFYAIKGLQKVHLKAIFKRL